MTRQPAEKRNERVVSDWPQDPKKRELEASAKSLSQKMLQAICLAKADEQGLSYHADERLAYEIRVPPKVQGQQPVAQIVGERLSHNDDGKGVLTLTVSVNLPGVTVRSKPARFTVVGADESNMISVLESTPQVAEEDFPALLPWSIAQDFPEIRLSITFVEGEREGDASIKLVNDATDWLMSLRFLQEAEKIKLLNLDQASVLSQLGRSQYQAFRQRLPQMLGQRGSSLVVLQQQIFPMIAGDNLGPLQFSGWRFRLEIPSGDESESDASTELLSSLRTREYHECDGIYPVSEIPNGQCQVWMTEDEVSDIDRLNGVEFRGRVFVAVRGYERGRYFRLWKWSGKGREKVNVKLAAGWGDWVEPATRFGVLDVTVDDGKVQWTPLQQQQPGMTPEDFDLDDWCFTQAEKDQLLDMLEFNDKPLQEQPKWSALPFE